MYFLIKDDGNKFSITLFYDNINEFRQGGGQFPRSLMLFLIPAITDFFKILKYFCYLSYFFHNFVSKMEVMKTNDNECLVIIDNHIAKKLFQAQCTRGRAMHMGK